VYSAPIQNAAERRVKDKLKIGPVKACLTPEDYQTKFQKVRSYLEAGDIYQANLTFPVTAAFQGESKALYNALLSKQPVKHGALITGQEGPDILSRSPELFFRRTATGTIETRPMKGTQPRGSTPQEDEANRTFLSSDSKNQAENLMIVDLLRNDLSRICDIGSFQVPELFKVESYETVHQMTSLILGKLRKDIGFSDIISALFPCGSITGAPKIRAMQILRRLEDNPRGIYCGSIGCASPSGAAEFNVAIRTLIKHADHLLCNVGGGIVYDSKADLEFDEAMWKTRFTQI